MADRRRPNRDQWRPAAPGGFHNRSMSDLPVNTRRQAKSHPGQGFTLVELMIALVIIGVLAALAYPTFLDAIRKGRRAEAFTALAAVQQAQERWRSNNATYASMLVNTARPNEVPTGLVPLDTTPSNYYRLAVSDATALGYTVTATALTGNSQFNDGNCKVLGARVTTGGNLSYGSGENSIDWADPGRCWAR